MYDNLPPSLPLSLLYHHVFRVFLRTIANPGIVETLPPSPLHPLLLLLGSIYDRENTFAVVGDEDGSPWRTRIATWTGSREAPIEVADFVVYPSGQSNETVLKVRRGSHLSPEQGVTMFFLVSRIVTHGNIRLRGPGIPTTRTISVMGMDYREFFHLQQVNQEYPLGVETVCVDHDGTIVAIPRSTRIEIIGED